jgi:hypothetical protein
VSDVPTSDVPTYEQLQQLVGMLTARVGELERVVAEQAGQAARVVELEWIVAEQADEIAELRRRSSADSSNSSRPPSSDAPSQGPTQSCSATGTRCATAPGRWISSPPGMPRSASAEVAPGRTLSQRRTDTTCRFGRGSRRSARCGT